MVEGVHWTKEAVETVSRVQGMYEHFLFKLYEFFLL